MPGADLRDIDFSAATGAGPRERLTPLAGSFAAGIALASWQDGPLFWPWIAGGLAALAACCALLRRGGLVAMAALAAGAMCLGAAWFVLRQHYVPPEDLAASGDRPRLLRLRGTAMAAPERRERGAGSLGRFDRRPPATYFPMRVAALLAHDGSESAACGSVMVRVDETLPPFRAGDAVDVMGILYPPSGPRNPGEIDHRRTARSRGQAGTLVVERRELVAARPQPAGRIVAAWLGFRAAVQRRAGTWVLANLPDAGRAQRDALLVALLLGPRGPDLEEVGESFRKTGLSHILAISGMHLTVMAGLVLFLVRLGGRVRRWHGWLVIALVLAYLVMVEVRAPVMRAGLMTMAACLGVAFGRRLQVSGLLAASAVALLLWCPHDLFSAGFQLSYGAVLGLVHVMPAVRARWFGPPDALSPTSARMLGQWVRDAGAASIAAWMVTTPIAIHHWGVMWPLAAPMTVLVLPLATAVLVIGYVKMVIAIALPSAGLLVGLPLALCTDLFVAMVQSLDQVPLSMVDVGYPPPVWALASLAWVAAWAASARPFGFWGSRRGRWLVRGWGVALLGWAAAAIVLRGPGAALRIDMLAVGDGSCYVLQSDGKTVVFDAGSLGDFDAGRRMIVPAMRRMGVRRVDAIIVSHPNLDHYSAVLEIVDEFHVPEVLVTPQFIGEASRDPAGPVMFLLEALGERLVTVSEARAGDRRTWGRAQWTWLHPRGGAEYPDLNDTSMVIRIDVADRRVLLCGDGEERALREAEAQAGGAAGLRADVAELPHHGSYNDRAAAFIGAAAPQIVFQSTGPARWERTAERWARALPAAERLVSTRDGACRVEIARDGSISARRFRRPRALRRATIALP